MLLWVASGCPTGLSAVSGLEGIVLGVQPVALQPGDHSECGIRQLHPSSFQRYLAALECMPYKASGLSPAPESRVLQNCGLDKFKITSQGLTDMSPTFDSRVGAGKVNMV